MMMIMMMINAKVTTIRTCLLRYHNPTRLLLDIRNFVFIRSEYRKPYNCGQTYDYDEIELLLFK